MNYSDGMQMASLEVGPTKIKTGVVSFGDDWPGIFIRGEETFGIIREINHILGILEKGGLDTSKFELSELREYILKNVVLLR